MSKSKTIMMWVSLGIASLAFAAAGAAKLAGVEAVHASFATMELPVWFGYFIGLCELAGAAGLWLRATSRYASVGLFIIMLGATYFHVIYETFPKAIPAMILAGLTVIIYVARRTQSNGNAQ
ncbi:DoxX family protein [Saccharophagus degradans]|nr:DoxX family protein [Saccharophagus degradans]MBU2985606.1 DoxX family protein [Saccharophagus degradans]